MTSDIAKALTLVAEAIDKSLEPYTQKLSAYSFATELSARLRESARSADGADDVRLTGLQTPAHSAGTKLCLCPHPTLCLGQQYLVEGLCRNDAALKSTETAQGQRAVGDEGSLHMDASTMVEPSSPIPLGEWLSCPFCGVSLEHSPAINRIAHPETKDDCPGKSFGCADDRRDVLAAWNRRTPPLGGTAGATEWWSCKLRRCIEKDDECSTGCHYAPPAQSVEHPLAKEWSLFRDFLTGLPHHKDKTILRLGDKMAAELDRLSTSRPAVLGAATGFQLVPCREGRFAWPAEMNDAADAFFRAHEEASKSHGFYESFYAGWNAALARLHSPAPVEGDAP